MSALLLPLMDCYILTGIMTSANPRFRYARPDPLESYDTASITHRRVEQAIQTLGRRAWILGPMGYALAHAGRTVEAANIANEIEPSRDAAVELAHVYTALGDKPRALDALERAYAQRIVDLNFMAVDPMLAGLRAEPRFVTLKGRMGL
jgi:hypothetical protein